MSQHYERLTEVGRMIESPITQWSKKDILRGYIAPLSQYIPHGWLGMVYLLWIAGIFIFNTLIVSGIVQVGFLRVLIPTSIEAGVIVLSLAVLFFLVKSATCNFNILMYADAYTPLGDNKHLSYQNVCDMVRSSYSVFNDLTLFVTAAVFMFAELCIMIVQATSATVTPNLNPDGPASTIVFNDGKAENFKLPLGPNADKSVSLYYLLHFWILVKCAVLIAVYFNPMAILSIRRRIYKFSKIFNSENKDGKMDIRSSVSNPSALKELAVRSPKAPMV